MSKNKTPHELKFAILASDVVCLTVHEGKLKVLLIPVNEEPHFVDMRGVPGGLIAPTETARDAAIRHLSKKAGLDDVYLEQLYTFSEVTRDPRGRVVAVAYLGLVPSTVVGKEAADALWIPVKRMEKLAYDHNDILTTAVERIRAKISYTNIACQLLPKEFTLGELQELYEVILGHDIDKRNFRKKIMSLKMVKPTGKKRGGSANRPAELYTCASKGVKEMEIL